MQAIGVGHLTNKWSTSRGKESFGTCLAFVDAINRHDVDALVALMTEDHCFVDGLGQVLRGREQMTNGWIGYFGWFPDYSIKLDQPLIKENQRQCGGIVRVCSRHVLGEWKALSREPLGNPCGMEGSGAGRAHF